MHNSLSIHCVLPLNLPLDPDAYFLERQKCGIIVVCADVELRRIERLELSSIYTGV